MKAVAVMCQAALEQAVLAAESPPHSMTTKAAYTAVSLELIRQSILAAIEAGVASDTVMRSVAEALVAAKRGLRQS